uniref:Putative Crossover junction endodeoxyribonuclease n=1 Tax=viral metagenome TaxID=1070528 RepID=A0A6H2A429_9ZZZZ
MITLKIKDLEKKLNRKISKNINLLAVDTASKTGWAKITTTDKDIKIDYGFIDIQSKDKEFKYNQMIDTFPELIKGCDKVIIEDVFLRFNVMVHSMLSRIGMIVYVIAHQLKVKDKYFIWASSSRKLIGLKNAKKDIVQKEFKEKFNIKIEDEDIIDSLILGFGGLIEKVD